MSITASIAIYFVIWWMVLFLVLPFGAKSAHEASIQVEKGHAPSAPLQLNMIKKIIATTILAAFVFAGVYLAVAYNVFAGISIPFMEFQSYS